MAATDIPALPILQPLSSGRVVGLLTVVVVVLLGVCLQHDAAVCGVAFVVVVGTPLLLYLLLVITLNSLPVNTVTPGLTWQGKEQHTLLCCLSCILPRLPLQQVA